MPNIFDGLLLNVGVVSCYVDVRGFGRPKGGNVSRRMARRNSGRGYAGEDSTTLGVAVMGEEDLGYMGVH